MDNNQFKTLQISFVSVFKTERIEFVKTPFCFCQIVILNPVIYVSFIKGLLYCLAQGVGDSFFCDFDNKLYNWQIQSRLYEIVFGLPGRAL